MNNGLGTMAMGQMCLGEGKGLFETSSRRGGHGAGTWEKVRGTWEKKVLRKHKTKKTRLHPWPPHPENPLPMRAAAEVRSLSVAPTLAWRKLSDQVKVTM